jgi:hypothetical protein
MEQLDSSNMMKIEMHQYKQKMKRIDVKTTNQLGN